MMTKKIVALLTLASIVLGPASALATTVTTTLQKGGSSNPNNAPQVVAKWEMDGPYTSYSGSDASTSDGAQIAPSGKYDVSKTVGICGIVIDPNGRDYISDVYGDVYYPAGVSLGSYHKDPVTGQLREVKTCSGEMVRECKMTKLSQDKAMNLFCTKIRSNNNNLPTFAPGYDYDKICDEAAAGVLVKETAYAYCCNFTMSYEDPAGNYTVNVWGTDIAGTNGNPLSNTMQYLQSKAFDVDFTGIDYGSVVPGIWKAQAGDTTWAETPTINGASIRNVSSTPIQIGVSQDDMGIKDPDGTTYITFGAAIGSGTAYTTYGPNASPTLINKTLSLSEVNEMDFQVKVSKFPQQLSDSFSGTMTLSAQNIPQLPCPL